MPNTYVNKVVKSDGATLIDLTSDTVTSASHIVAGYVGHLADGSQVTGTAPKKHTATVTARTNSGGYVRYIGSTGTQYRTIGDTFEFNPGEELYAVGMDSRGLVGKIIIDGVTVASGGQDSVTYTYTLPDHDISISFSAGTTSIEEASSVSLQSKTVSYTPTETAQAATVTADSGYDGLSSVEVSVGAISSSYVGSGIDRRSSSDLTASGATVTVPSGYYASQATKSVASGTEGTPTATKGSVSNHSVSVTPSVTNAAGYISGGTKTGTAVTVSASELVSGSETVTENGTVDVTNLASVVVNVPSGGTPAISVVDTTDSHGGTVRTITALDISDTTAVAADVAQGKYFYTAQGVKTAGSASGGTPSQTQHTIYFEFSDSTDTTITGYWNDSFISDAITATTPTTYGSKTVSLAQLDGVTWYEPANIPIGVELIDYTKVTNGVYIGEDGEENANEWSVASDYTLVDPTMTFSYTGWYWYYVGVYDSNKNFIRAIYVYTDGTVDPNDSNTAHGVLSGNELMGASYVRLCGTEGSSSKLSLIRTA